MVGYVYHGEEDAEVVFTAERADARVDVFRMKPVQGQQWDTSELDSYKLYR